MLAINYFYSDNFSPPFTRNRSHDQICADTLLGLLLSFQFMQLAFTLTKSWSASSIILFHRIPQLLLHNPTRVAADPFEMVVVIQPKTLPYTIQELQKIETRVPDPLAALTLTGKPNRLMSHTGNQ